MIESTGIVLHGNKRFEIVTEPVSEPTGRQVLVRTHAVGLCGSDMSLYAGTYAGPQNYPIYFGHEWSGVVKAVGPAVTRVKPGDHVTGDCSISCGQCELCRQDRNLCRRIEKFGITVDGASRQYFLQDERYLYRTDPAIHLDFVALSEPLAVGVRAVRRVLHARPDLRDEKILVMGGGTIGLACYLALQYVVGCRNVEVFDLIDARARRAHGLGAAALTDVLSVQDESGDYDDLYSGRGYDVIFETTASPAAFRQAVDLLRPLGTLMTLGFTPPVKFSPKTITLKAASIMGSMGGTGDFERVLSEITQRHPDAVQQLISHRVPHTDVERAFEIAADRLNALKVLVTF